MNTLMIIGFLGMTATAIYYWMRCRYLESVIDYSKYLVSALGLKIANLEGRTDGVLEVNVQKELQEFKNNKEKKGD